MPGPAPKTSRMRRNKPELGEWVASEGIGWQHGEIPLPPEDLKATSVAAWHTWFRSWFAAHWTPDDVPGLRLVIRMYDDVERGSQTKAADRASLHAWMRSYGITPDGQQKLRWVKPVKPEGKPSSPQPKPESDDNPYAHLRVVNG